MLKTKNRRSAILLLALVVIIWGIIAFKIIKHLYFPDSVPFAGNGTITQETNMSKEPLRYSFSYTDPFLKGRSNAFRLNDSQHEASASFAIKEPVVPKEKPKVEAPVNFHFKGWVSNSHTGHKEALVIQDGRVHILEVGEAINEYVLIRVFADSIVVNREGHQFCLKRE